MLCPLTYKLRGAPEVWAAELPALDGEHAQLHLVGGERAGLVAEAFLVGSVLWQPIQWHLDSHAVHNICIDFLCEVRCMAV